MAQVSEWRRGDTCWEINKGSSIRPSERLCVKTKEKRQESLPKAHVPSTHISLPHLACLHLINALALAMSDVD